jgi:hypothetical protein
MAHPIFDRSSYAWDRQEAKDLFDVVVASIPQQAEIAQLYAQAGGDPGVLDTGQAPHPLWTDALNRLAEQEKLRRLCEEVLPGIQRLKGAERFQAALKAVAEAVPAVERKIIAGVPVLDRQPLRQLVEQLKSDAALRVLLVRGNPKTGKTWGRHLFIAGARDQGAEAVYLFAPMVATVDDVVQELFGVLGAGDQVPARDTTAPAWYASVCRKLGSVAIEKRKLVWIAVDDLGAAAEDGAPLLDPEIAKFCAQLVFHMANPAFGKWFRLMLIHYPDGPVPTRWLQETWREDRPTGAEGEQQDIVEYLRDWAAEQDGRAFLAGEAEALAAQVIQQVDSPKPEEAGVPRLQRLHDKLAETLRARG